MFYIENSLLIFNQMNNLFLLIHNAQRVFINIYLKFNLSEYLFLL